MLTACLVHFPDRESRIVMTFDDGAPRAGDEFIHGWVVERQADAEVGAADYEREVWVKPRI